MDFGFEIEVCSLESSGEPTARLGAKILQVTGSVLKLLHYAHGVGLGILSQFSGL